MITAFILQINKNETPLPTESNKTHGRQFIKIACRSETGYNTPYFQIIFRRIPSASARTALSKRRFFNDFTYNPILKNILFVKFNFVRLRRKKVSFLMQKTILLTLLALSMCALSVAAPSKGGGIWSPLAVS